MEVINNMTQQKIPEWLQEEADKLTQPIEYEELPSLKLTPNAITEIQVDSSQPFKTWSGTDSKNKPITKKIIPVSVAGTRMNFWLNVKNPIYREIINACKNGITTFKVLQTGTQANTKYVLIR